MADLNSTQFAMSGNMPDPRGKSYEDLFGRPAVMHSHPATHPVWMQFSNEDCPVCGGKKNAVK